MNAKERELHRIVDIVVGCCSVSFGGRVSLSRAYRIASAEAAELCREAGRKDDEGRGKEEE